MTAVLTPRPPLPAPDRPAVGIGLGREGERQRLCRPFGAQRQEGAGVHGFRALRALHPWLLSGRPFGAVGQRLAAADRVPEAMRARRASGEVGR